MSSQELKSHINSMLGNSMRCLLPSYWWKKLFGAVVDKLDEKVDASNLKTIGGESLIGEGDITIVGEKGDKGEQGEQGTTGPQGPQGVSVTSVVQTTTSSADGGSNVVTVTLSDGKTSTFTVKNGSKGSQGEKGDTGAEGPKGDKGEKGADGAQGLQGERGEQGPQGNSGYTGAADELEVVNNLTQGGATAALSAEQGKILKTEVTELSAEVSEVSENLGTTQTAISELAGKVDNAELLSGSFQAAQERANTKGGTWVWLLKQGDIKKPIWHIGDGNFIDAAGAAIQLEPESVFRYTIILTQDNDTIILPTALGKEYNMVVDWGDGSDVQSVSGLVDRKSITHTYSGAAGTKYQITLKGVVPGLIFGGDGKTSTPAQLYSIDENTIQNDIRMANDSIYAVDFRNCINLVHVSENAFHNSEYKTRINFKYCSSLKSLPPRLLDGFELTTLTDFVAGCSVLELSEDFMNALAQKISGVKSFFYAFQGCKKVEISPSFFDYIQANALTDVRSFLANSGAVGDAKALYDAIQSKVSSSVQTQLCFNATTLSNRDQVPKSWGGTM